VHGTERIDRRLALKAGGLQLLAVGVVFAVLALSLPRSFFEDWGIVAGPAAWIACAALTARVLQLPIGRTLLVAAGAGLLGAAAGLGIGHDAGIVVAIALFGVLAGATIRRRATRARMFESREAAVAQAEAEAAGRSRS
jgi:hypothetical protein